ncbi:glycoside hydrolase family 3 C-terminal domain-containing protein [Microbacterium sp. RU33B]|uniref:glycoside hydrolase family 3 C-terminal domain-containing protein n=1 Tax=Microbacterium sp. RU33B TaxID=1907390 RepID=UPI0009657DC0|nr:glycoside hydrolase family 3 C-terminal domain-containing protein [Microbacterium sp. RU33B]SIT83478.1 beta-glucosidase [Microbacterium sp. RU33B]
MINSRARLVWMGAAVLAAVIAVGPVAPAVAAVDDPWMDTSLSPDQRAELLVDVLTLEEKVTLLIQSGGPGLPQYGVPAIRGKDGCCGVAATDTDSTALPVGIALASTFDLGAAEAYGAVAANEARAFGFNGLAGPTMDLLTTPLNGRMWEAFGEDPLVSGEFAAAQTIGTQSQDISVIAKHYNLNNQETRRGHVDAVVDERTLQEVYTRPWETLVRDSDPGAVMCAFNKVNGEYACGNDELLNGILKGQLGFQGYVSSDFNATHSFADYEAGLDVSGPGTEFAGGNLVAAVQNGQVSEERVTDAARRVLRTFFALGIIDNPPPGSFENPQPASTPLDAQTIADHDAVARAVADASAVLLTNDGTLPLDDDGGSIAVIGSDADWYIDGGGSGAIQRPAQLTTILDGITDRAAADVTYSPGTDAVSLADTLPGPVPVPSSVLRPSSGADEDGLSAFYWFGFGFQGEPRLIRTEPQVNYRTGISNDPINTSQVPSPGVGFAVQPISVVWSGTLTAPASGSYELSLSHLGSGKLLVDGETIIDDPGTTYGTQSVAIDLVEGQEYFVEISYQTDAPNQLNGGLNDQPGAMVRFGWVPPAGVLNPTIEEAVAAAATADTAVIVARDYTGEAADRGSLVLPQDQDALIEAVAAVNDNTIVVLATSGPVAMPWIDDVSAVLEAWYPGQAQGRSVAGLLFGDVNPSGKLPVTFPVDDAQVDAVGGDHQHPFTQITEVDPTTVYDEGIYVGYKAYIEQGATPLFPFGHGLSYTSFEYADTATAGPVDPNATDPVATTATVTVTNTGDTAGTEVVQAYVGNLPTDVETVDLALAGFARVSLDPGQSAEVAIPIDRRSLQYWDVETDSWVTPSGSVPLHVGSSSADIRATGTITVEEPDVTAPTLTVTADPATPNGDNGWYTAPVTLTFTAADETDPAPVVEVSINGGEFAVQDGPLTLDQDGVYTVTARATDAAGNVSEPVTTEVKIDGTAPTVTAERSRLRVFATLTATDETSGVASIEYRYSIRVGNRTVTTPWRTYRGPVLAAGGSRIAFQYRATDNAGNVSETGTLR